ncbi:DUF2085 domain-containing protein [Patescibacteria group bacterium]|nr:DUF2085 domain-containing protein [Patescibacteria group bacterium]
MSTLRSVLNFFGFSVCHQIPSKTYSAFGVPICFCARCLGIYTAFFLVFTYYFGIKRAILGKHANNALPRGYYLFSFGLVVLMPLDVLFQAIGLYHSNTMRLITGLLFGFGMAQIILMLYVDIFRSGTKKVRQAIFSRLEFLIQLISIVFIACIILFQNDYILFGTSILAVLGLVMLGIVVHLIAFAIFSEFILKKKITRVSVPLFILAVVFVMGELAFLYFLHKTLV